MPAPGRRTLHTQARAARIKAARCTHLALPYPTVTLSGAPRRPAGTLRAFFRGNGTNVIKITPETAIKLAANDYIKRCVVAEGEHITPVQRLQCGALAGATAQARAGADVSHTFLFRVRYPVRAGRETVTKQSSPHGAGGGRQRASDQAPQAAPAVDAFATLSPRVRDRGYLCSGLAAGALI